MPEPLSSASPRLRQLRSLSEASRSLTYTTSVEEIEQLGVERAAQLLEAEKAALVFSAAGGPLEVRATFGLVNAADGTLDAPSDTAVAERLRVLLGCDDESHLVTAPLIIGGEVAGELAVTRPPERPPTDGDEWLLAALADQTCLALQNARVLESARQRREQSRSSLDRPAGEEHRSVSNVGHELRSPLTAIDGYSALLLDELYGPICEEQRDVLRRIRLSGQHLLSVLENVMEMARLQAGGPPELFELCLTTLLQDTIRILEPLAAEKQIRLEVEPGPDLLVHCNPSGTFRALLNLLDNAVDFSPSGGTVRVSITPQEHRGRPMAALAVADDGPGIEPHLVEEIFEPYVRGPQPGGRKGIGLGLAVCRELARRMNGELRAENRTGAGAVFTLLLPLSTPVEQGSAGGRSLKSER